jgi:zinc transport system ATP-binding protein
MQPIVSVKKLFVRVGAMSVLEDIDIEINPGDYIGLAGPNGAGKSTFIKAILGLLPREKGFVELFGEPVEKFFQWQKVGYLPQRAISYNPLFPATVEEVIQTGLLAGKKIPKFFSKEDAERLSHVLNMLKIGPLKHRLISELSGGQQQKVFFARAIVSQPDLLVLDEPNTALDPQSRELFYQLLQRLNEENHTTIILISHDIASIGQYASKLLYLDKTKIFYGKFSDFCVSGKMSKYFGDEAQHIICHQHH